MRWSKHGDEGEVKQRSSDEEESKEVQSRGDQGEAGTSSQEQTKTRRAQDWIIRGKIRRSGPGETTTKGGGRRHDTPRTGTSRAEQAAGAATPRTRTSEDKWRPDAPDGRIRYARSRGSRPPDWNIRGQAAAERHGRERRPRRARAADTRARQWRYS